MTMASRLVYASVRHFVSTLRQQPTVDTAAVTALLDRLLHHTHVLKCGPRSWRTRVQTTLPTQGAVR